MFEVTPAEARSSSRSTSSCGGRSAPGRRRGPLRAAVAAGRCVREVAARRAAARYPVSRRRHGADSFGPTPTSHATHVRHARRASRPASSIRRATARFGCAVRIRWRRRRSIRATSATALTSSTRRRAQADARDRRDRRRSKRCSAPRCSRARASQSDDELRALRARDLQHDLSPDRHLQDGHGRDGGRRSRATRARPARAARRGRVGSCRGSSAAIRTLRRS